MIMSERLSGTAEEAQRTERLRKTILGQLDRSREVSDEEVLYTIDRVLTGEGKSAGWSLARREKERQELFYSLRKLGILQELIDDPGITEIMINGTEGIFIEQNGCIRRWEKQFFSRESLENIIQQMVARTNRRVNEADPIVDTRLENGSRVNVVLRPVALNGPIVTIRRFPDDPVTMEQLLAWDSITGEAAAFLEKLVQAGYNIFISGGTGSGKTTFLNVLSNYIPPQERVITIEDAAELQLRSQPNLVRLETRSAGSDGTGAITMGQLIKSALRMRPDRIIVGEVRGGEALDMLQAFNTGHDGSLSTGHANSARDMLSRLETMVLMGMDLPLTAVRRQIASGLDVIVHLGRMRDHTRKVLEIGEITGFVQGEIQISPLFRFEEQSGGGEKVMGRLERCGSLTHLHKLQRAGLEQ